MYRTEKETTEIKKQIELAEKMAYDSYWLRWDKRNRSGNLERLAAWGTDEEVRELIAEELEDRDEQLMKQALQMFRNGMDSDWYWNHMSGTKEEKAIFAMLEDFER